MIPLGRRPIAWAISAGFLLVWAVLLHFFAVNACTESGGRVGLTTLDCEMAGDKLVSLFVLVGTLEMVMSFAVAAVMAGAAIVIFTSRKG